jgi:hypothetical protein
MNEFMHPTGAVDPNTLWALELVNGDRCAFAAGVAGDVDGERITYDCAKGVVIGSPDRSTRMWTARYNRNGSREVNTVQVRRAWR